MLKVDSIRPKTKVELVLPRSKVDQIQSDQIEDRADSI